jgi:hypothetical protein
MPGDQHDAKLIPSWCRDINFVSTWYLNWFLSVTLLWTLYQLGTVLIPRHQLGSKLIQSWYQVGAEASTSTWYQVDTKLMPSHELCINLVPSWCQGINFVSTCYRVDAEVSTGYQVDNEFEQEDVWSSTQYKVDTKLLPSRCLVIYQIQNWYQVDAWSSTRYKVAIVLTPSWYPVDSWSSTWYKSWYRVDTSWCRGSSLCHYYNLNYIFSFYSAKSEMQLGVKTILLRRCSSGYTSCYRFTVSTKTKHPKSGSQYYQQ